MKHLGIADGAEAQDAIPEELEIWPENWLLWDVWIAMTNRWRIIAGMSGAVWQGLDLTQAESVLSLKGAKRKDRQRVLNGLLDMEREALPILNGG